MDYTSSLATIAGVVLLGCLSPGPNFLVVTSRALTMSRQAGVLAGLGVALASLTWASLTIAGLALMLQHAAWLLTALQLTGAAYLIYIGIRTVLSARQPVPTQSMAMSSTPPLQDVWSGFLTSMTNPKAAGFFGSLFVVTLPIGAPPWVYGLTLAIVTALSAAWHCGLALFFSLGLVRAAYRRSKTTVSTVMGSVLVLLGPAPVLLTVSHRSDRLFIAACRLFLEEPLPGRQCVRRAHRLAFLPLIVFPLGVIYLAARGQIFQAPLLQWAAQLRLALQPCPFLVIGHERRCISRVVLLQPLEDVLAGLLGRRPLPLIGIEQPALLAWPVIPCGRRFRLGLLAWRLEGP